MADDLARMLEQYGDDDPRTAYRNPLMELTKRQYAPFPTLPPLPYRGPIAENDHSRAEPPRVQQDVAQQLWDAGPIMGGKGLVDMAHLLHSTYGDVRGHINEGDPMGALGAAASAWPVGLAALPVPGARRAKTASMLEPQKTVESEYRGQHGVPDHESGSPIYDVTKNGIYPKDFYGPQGLRYYGTGDGALDANAYYKIMGLKDKPDAMVPVYRAIPEVAGKPKGLTLGSQYINPGDWVTISRQYAVDHGDSALNGKYHIVKKMVPAKELHTAGDSFLEWGWMPETKP